MDKGLLVCAMDKRLQGCSESLIGGELLGGISEAGKTGSWPLILVGALVVLGAAVALAKLAGGKKE